MGLPIIIAVLAISVWCLSVTLRRLRRNKASRVWFLSLAFLTVTGLITGTWLALNFEMQVSQHFRVFSFPLPLAFFHLEDGRWVDFVPPKFVMYPGIAANIAAVTAIATLPVLIASLKKHRPAKSP